MVSFFRVLGCVSSSPVLSHGRIQMSRCQIAQTSLQMPETVSLSFLLSCFHPLILHFPLLLPPFRFLCLYYTFFFTFCLSSFFSHFSCIFFFVIIILWNLHFLFESFSTIYFWSFCSTKCDILAIKKGDCYVFKYHLEQIYRKIQLSID